MKIGEQLQRLEAAGLRFAPGVESELVQREVPALLEDPPFTRLIQMLGDGRSREPFEPLCDQLWMCHSSRIHDPGAYVAVLQRLERMTAGVLGIRDMVDHVDRRARRAWIEFTCRGQRHHQDLAVEGRWLDPRLIERYDELLHAHGVDVRLFADVGERGELLFLGAFSPVQKARFDALVAFCFAPLDVVGFAARRRAHVRRFGLWWVWMVWWLGPGSQATVAAWNWLRPDLRDDLASQWLFGIGLMISHGAAVFAVALSAVTGVRRLPEFWGLLGYLVIGVVVGSSLLLQVWLSAPWRIGLMVVATAFAAVVPVVGAARLWRARGGWRTRDAATRALLVGLVAGTATALAWWLAFAVVDQWSRGSCVGAYAPCAAPVVGFAVALGVSAGRLERSRRRAALHPPPPPVASPLP